MRLLVDENLSFRVAERLRTAHDVVHVTEVALNNADERIILSRAVSEGRVVVTSDADFGTLLAFTGAARPSVVLLRSSDHLAPGQQGGLPLTVPDQLVSELSDGAVASISPGRIRIRSLPIGGR